MTRVRTFLPIAAAVALATILATSPTGARPGATDVRGVVFDDRNGNGRRDAAEPGVPGAAVSNQDTVVITDSKGEYRMTGAGVGVVHVSVPDGWRSVGPFWRQVSGDQGGDFALVRAPLAAEFTFIHASDTHIAPTSVNRTERFRALVDSLKPAFVIVTGDLVRDALRVSEQEARSYYELFGAQAEKFSRPLWTVPGNHEVFGIERTLSKVAATNPLYGRAMYRHYRGPDYYSFNAGGVHFVGLNSVDIDDTNYYGHIDSLQLAWLSRDIAAVKPGVPVVTFNHIPFFTAVETINGYRDSPPAPSVITVRGVSNFRHTVSNARDVLERVKPHPFPIALGGHMHVREQIRYAGVATRFYQTAAVVAPTPGAGMTFPSGITLYRVRAGVIDDGQFIPLGLDKTPPR